MGRSKTRTGSRGTGPGFDSGLLLRGGFRQDYFVPERMTSRVTPHNKWLFLTRAWSLGLICIRITERGLDWKKLREFGSPWELLLLCDFCNYQTSVWENGWIVVCFNWRRMLCFRFDFLGSTYVMWKWWVHSVVDFESLRSIVRSGVYGKIKLQKQDSYFCCSIIIGVSRSRQKERYGHSLSA